MTLDGLSAAELGFVYAARCAGCLEVLPERADETAAYILARRAPDIDGEAVDEGWKGARSEPADDGLALRRWLDSGDGQPLGARLVVLGAVLVGRLEGATTRRRLALLLGELPRPLGRAIQDRLAEAEPMEDAVERRVSEVYCRIAAGDHPPDEEFAMVGLFFLISAGIFRQNAVLSQLENSLSPTLARRCRKYRRACIRSNRPELTPAIAEALRPMINGADESDQSGTENQEDGDE